MGHRHKSTHPIPIGRGIELRAAQEYGGIFCSNFHFGRSGQIKPPPARVELSLRRLSPYVVQLP